MLTSVGHTSLRALPPCDLGSGVDSETSPAGKIRGEGPAGQRLSFPARLLHVCASLSPPSSALPRGSRAPLLRHSWRCHPGAFRAIQNPLPPASSFSFHWAPWTALLPHVHPSPMTPSSAILSATTACLNLKAFPRFPSRIVVPCLLPDEESLCQGLPDGQDCASFDSVQLWCW